MSLLDNVLGETSRTQTTNRTFSAPIPLSGTGSFGQAFNFESGGSNNFINLPGIQQQRQDIWNRTNDIVGAVQNDIQGLRALENPFFQARVRPTQEKFANFEADTQRGLARRGVFGSIANNELIKINQAGTRAVADQGALAKKESFDAILNNQQFQGKLFELMRGLNQDEATQALKELELLANIAGTSLSTIRETSTTTETEEQSDPSEEVASLLDVLGELTGGITGVTSLISDIAGLFDGSIGDVIDDGLDSVGDVIDDITETISDIFSPPTTDGGLTEIDPTDFIGDTGTAAETVNEGLTQIDPTDLMGDTGGPGDSGLTEIDPADFLGDTVNVDSITGALPGVDLTSLGAQNIIAMGGGDLTAAGALGGAAAQNAALATGGVDAFTGLTATGLEGGFAGGATTAAPAGLGGALGTAIGAALPLAMIGIGQYINGQSEAKSQQWAAPIIQQAMQTPMTTVNGVRGIPITHDGEQYIATPEIQEHPEWWNDAESILAYRPSTGEYGNLSRRGWFSDLDGTMTELEDYAQEYGGKHYTLDDVTGPRTVRDPNNMSQFTKLLEADILRQEVPREEQIDDINQNIQSSTQASAAAEAQRQAAIAAGNAAAAHQALLARTAAEHARVQAERDWEEMMWGEDLN